MSLINFELMEKLSQEFVLKHMILPIKKENNVITIEVCEKNENILNYLKTIYGMEVNLVLRSREELRKKIEEQYKIFGNMNSNGENKLVEEIIKLAIRERASDIHFECYKEKCVIRFRIDGVMFTKFILNVKQYNALIIRVKFLANMDIADKLIPQDGKLSFQFEDTKNFDLRVSSVPTIQGEKLVIRLLFKNEELLNIEKMCYTEKQKRLMDKIIKVQEGLVIICGPTGSGKSTTLYSLLKQENSNELNITTIEDPTEFIMNDINQININEKIGLSFSKALKHVLRQDPDVIMVGEIRDEDTAQNAVRAAITGHKVYSTLHTDSIFNVWNRLKDMGVKEYLIKDSIKAIISQRLIRKLCPNCRRLIEVDDNDLKIKKAYKAVGCKQCNNGYSGRIVVSEILYGNLQENTKLSEENFQSKEECLCNYVENGYISFDDFKRYLSISEDKKSFD